jgi:hypothetical protein
MRLMVSVRVRPSSSRRSTSSRSATVASSAATMRRFGLRSPATATLWVGVDRVGLAALAGVEHSRPRGQFRGHVENGFAVGDQALGDVPADPGTPLDRPHPVRELAAGRSIA